MSLAEELLADLDAAPDEDVRPGNSILDSQDGSVSNQLMFDPFDTSLGCGTRIRSLSIHFSPLILNFITKFSLFYFPLVQRFDESNRSANVIRTS